MSSMLRVLKRMALGGCLLAVPIMASGQNAFSPGGNDYVIAGALPGDQTFPHAVINSSGGFLVWQDNAVAATGNKVRAARLDASLHLSGAPFVVSTGTRAGQGERPQAAMLNNGGAVVVWQDGPFGFQNIYARFLAAGGSFTTGEIRVNTYTNEFQVQPSVAVLKDGTVVVVWGSYGQDGSMQGIYGQRFSAAGEKLGSEFRLNDFTSNNQRTPAVAALADGGFVAVWISELQRGSASVDVIARRFDATGTALDDEFIVNPSKTNLCANPSVAGSPSGGFAVVWGQNDNVTLALATGSAGTRVTARAENGWDIFGRLFSANGAALAGPIRLNTYVYGDQYGPRISAFGKEYLTVWTSLGQDRSWEGVFGQFLTSEGTLAGVEFQINTTAVSRQMNPTVASDGLNRFLVNWSSFQVNTSFDLFARIYDLIRIEMTTTAQGLVLTWNAQPGWSYQVLMSDDGKTWRNLGGQRVASGLSDSVNVGAAGDMTYYRVIRVVTN